MTFTWGVDGQLMWQVPSVGAWEDIDIDWSESLFQQIPHPSPHMEQPVWSKALLTNQLDACWYMRGNRSHSADISNLVHGSL
jgi:hypothetical protein